ncbi:MAG TPA: flavin reductase family protein [Myxococcales bacterium]|jgi:flavin reductase (DIM6/NTAB) family NADH-FMN oxidoreductase RutF
MGQNDIRAALESIPLPVTVVTVGRGGVENGLTVSWLSLASFEPAMVLFSIDKRHYSEELIRSTKTFVVNVLGEDQKKLAGHFAQQAIAGEDKFAGLKTSETPSGGKILDDALSWLDCEVEAIHPAGDHLIVVGKVLDASVKKEGAALTTASGIHYRKSKP